MVPDVTLFPDQIDLYQKIRVMFRNNNLFYKNMRASTKGLKFDEIQKNLNKLLHT